ncbi:MAG: DUF547 domain-containing protein [Candidatus Omnitrophica bacterium]|nr:DUF547 domain-containing protein [Candidatus Omnitrophota bacterium]MCB9722221.1 DUF547 domain-containing protein [Candidatus Omnitrophota bacterium]
MVIRLILCLLLITGAGLLPEAEAAQSQTSMDYSAYDTLLHEYVNPRGLVDYERLCADPALRSVTEQLSHTDPGRLEREEALAFWINVYNAFTLQVICDNYPLESINDLHGGGLVLGTVFKTTIWDKKWFAINGQEVSLAHVEHKILRPQFGDPRIHFAIVCAARSCPPLRAEAYVAGRIEKQLDDQGRIFLSRPDLNRFDLKSQTAYLSGIFKWFLKDFGKNKKDLLRYLAAFAPSPEVRDLLENQPIPWTVRWNDYDWSLNRQ